MALGMTGGSIKSAIAAGPARRRLLAIALFALAACVAAAVPLASAPAAAPSAEAAAKKKKAKKCKKAGKKKAGKKSAPKKKAKKCKRGKKPGKPGNPNPTVPPAPHTPPGPPSTVEGSGLERAVFVGNNWEGTADVLRFEPPAAAGEDAQFTLLGRLNIIPDHDERMQEILLSPDKLAFFLAIRMGVGEGNDQFVDDMYSTNDGRLLVVSRPSFADVIGMDLATGEIVWRFPMEGYRSDHMGVSPNGRHVVVSDSTANKAHVLEMATGVKVAEFLSGDSPHENTYSADGSRIFHASIGRVYLPTDQPVLSPTKGAEYFQIVDASSCPNQPSGTEPCQMEILRRHESIGQKIEDDTCGPDAVADKCHSDMSSAVRPMAISPDERFIYFQVSFFHGFIEYDVENDRVLRVAELPDVYQQPRETYILDSAHHGIAMNDAGTKLCAAGTMSDYAAIVSRADFQDFTVLPKAEGARSYWSTTSDDGEHCFVSWSGTDSVSAISYQSEEEVAEIEVGDPDDGRRAHPQRVRTGVIPDGWVPPTG